MRVRTQNASTAWSAQLRREECTIWQTRSSGVQELQHSDASSCKWPLPSTHTFAPSPHTCAPQALQRNAAVLQHKVDSDERAHRLAAVAAARERSALETQVAELKNVVEVKEVMARTQVGVGLCLAGFCEGHLLSL